jgi:hypothetical protein
MKVNLEITGKKAIAILYALSEYEVDEFAGFLETSAFYNGRERGVAITAHSFASNRDWAIVFGEHRNSDSIFVDMFEFSGDINPPTIANFTEEAYKDRHFFSYNQVGQAAEYIFHQIQQRIQPLIKKLPVEKERSN